MPISIGTVENTFTNPIGLMCDCHRRIERFLTILSAVADRAKGGPLNDEQRSALETALKYFHEASPRHIADEEQDLFPMLRRLERPQVSKILHQVEQLESQHKTAEAWHGEVEQIGGRWLRHNRISDHEIARLGEVLDSLAGLYSAHIAVEEELVFPMAQVELSVEDKRALGRGMASRRGVPFPAE